MHTHTVCVVYLAESRNGNWEDGQKGNGRNMSPTTALWAVALGPYIPVETVVALSRGVW